MAWLAYVPVPGLALVPALLHPESRLARYHAWQGTATVLGLIGFLLVMGLLARLSDASAYRTAMGFVAGLGLLLGLGQCGWGMVAAALGRFARIRPWWDAVAALTGRP